VSGLPKNLPNTASWKGAPPRWPVVVLMGIGALAIILFSASLVRSLSFSPGEELDGGWMEGISISPENSPYPPPDVDVFDRRPGVAYVYATVGEMPSGAHLEARVQRARATAALSRIFDSGEETLALERLETRSGAGENPGVVRFAITEKSGDALPPGDYTVGVYRASGGGPIARKYFVVRG